MLYFVWIWVIKDASRFLFFWLIAKYVHTKHICNIYVYIENEANDGIYDPIVLFFICTQRYMCDSNVFSICLTQMQVITP